MNFVFDIDGTLCFDGKTIDLSIIEAINELTEEGHEIIFASARPIRDLIPVLPSNFKKNKLVGGNGCFVSDNGKITTSYFDPQLVDQLHNIIHTYDLAYLADGKRDYSFTGNKDHPIYKNIDQSTAQNRELASLSKICKLVLFNPPEAIIEEINQLPVTVTLYKNENAVDLSSLGINKVYGLQKLQITDFIAFGNDSNDQCLFENAIFSVCIGTNDVKKYASKSIKSEEVATTIREMKNYLVESIK
ncbi:HAD-IIB family hydrolase [Ureibacillus manganicus]|uniref:Hydrolase n=1 Tax=Ureibacillus manganicus DSM 26584 TaxID=1384049 RepID=A0A0A3I7E9_9BACL|nr:HAD-IIB family hydrolase [Ureibacillus manganicus]KGR79435.1 hydrolase [Ureibacillus manganicus DSM 26584]